MTNSNCSNSCVTPKKSGSGYVAIIVLYILLAIILCSTIC